MTTPAGDGTPATEQVVWEQVVWVVVKYGVYDQGVWLVATSETEAETFCASHSPDTDGYHDWRIERHVVGRRGATYPPHPKTKTWPTS